MWQIITVIFIIAGGIWIGWDYSSEKRKLKYFIDETEFTPTRLIFYYDGKSKHMSDLMTLAIKGHTRAGIAIRSNIMNQEEGYISLLFDNGDIIQAYEYGKAQLAPMKKHDISSYTTQLYVDSVLPDSAIRAIIKELGLNDYMIQLGLVTEKGIK